MTSRDAAGRSVPTAPLDTPPASRETRDLADGEDRWLPASFDDAAPQLAVIEPCRTKQLIPAHKPGEGAIGDCYRACIASMLGESDASVVPHFMEWSIAVEKARGVDTRGGWEAYRLTRRWLRENTLYDLLTVHRERAAEYGVPYMVSVNSKTGPWPHCVLAIADEVWWDPSGVGGYTLADVRENDDTADVLTYPFEPGPDEMVRQWALAAIAELDEEVRTLREAEAQRSIEAVVHSGGDVRGGSDAGGVGVAGTAREHTT